MNGKTAALTALAYYEARAAHDPEAQRNLVANSEPGEIVDGLLTLVGSLLATCAATDGVTPEQLVANLRHMWLAHS